MKQLNLNVIFLLIPWFFGVGAVWAQPTDELDFRFRDGILISAGSSYSDFSPEFASNPVSRKSLPAFSWEAGYQNTRSLGRDVAASYGFLVSGWESRFVQDDFSYQTHENLPRSFQFASALNIARVYSLGLSFQLPVFFNRNVTRWFISPGVSLRSPAINQVIIKGNLLADQPRITIRDRYFYHDPPYIFIQPELSFGMQKVVGDYHMFRSEIVLSVRETGRFRTNAVFERQAFLGVRLQYYFNGT